MSENLLSRGTQHRRFAFLQLDHRALAFTLVSAAHDGEPPTTRRYKFTDKETFSTWAHGLMVAIKFSERRTRRGSLVQLMGSSDGQAIKVSADL